eukprot:COSAG01_NODE_10512_length_2148_cov_1.187408_2_plen_98_part_00
MWRALRAGACAGCVSQALSPAFGAAWLSLARAQLNFGEFAKAAESFARLQEVDATLAADPEVMEDVARTQELHARHCAMVRLLSPSPPDRRLYARDL